MEDSLNLIIFKLNELTAHLSNEGSIHAIGSGAIAEMAMDLLSKSQNTETNSKGAKCKSGGCEVIKK